MSHILISSVCVPFPRAEYYIVPTFFVAFFKIYYIIYLKIPIERKNNMEIKVKYLYVLGAFIVLCIIGYFSLPRDEIVIQASSNDEVEEEYIYVHIEGCVHEPGLIKAIKGIRLYELIELAGGETEEADLSKVNLASIVTDAQKIYIPQKIIYVETDEGISSISKDGIVNINTATSNELQTLSGIGPSMAARIIDYREKEGYFTKPEDIMNVSGIGEAKYNRIKDKITT